MPTVAIVDGVKIIFYFNEHPPAHFHAHFSEFRAVIEIEDLSLTGGSPPPAKLRSVLAWAETRKEKLLRAFATAAEHEELGSIE
jgi:hypothetical protein